MIRAYCLLLNDIFLKGKIMSLISEHMMKFLFKSLNKMREQWRRHNWFKGESNSHVFIKDQEYWNEPVRGCKTACSPVTLTEGSPSAQQEEVHLHCHQLVRCTLQFKGNESQNQKAWMGVSPIMRFPARDICHRFCLFQISLHSLLKRRWFSIIK